MARVGDTLRIVGPGASGTSVLLPAGASEVAYLGHDRYAVLDPVGYRVIDGPLVGAEGLEVGNWLVGTTGGIQKAGFPSGIEWNYNLSRIELVTDLSTQHIFDTYIATFFGINAGPVASIAFEHGGLAVTAVGQRATFTMKPYQIESLNWLPTYVVPTLDLLQGPFSVKVVRFDPANRVIAVHTEPFHPVTGWRFFRVYESGVSPRRVRVETGAYERPGVDNLPAVWPLPGTPLSSPNPFDMRNVLSYQLFSGVQLKFWEYYLKAIETDTGAARTSDSLVEGDWNISDAHLRYIQKQFCGGAVPLANGNCP
ncbi:MAG: hypothetical protein ABIT71_03990 [Vicinamibacteraceae bacterium]